MKMNSIFAFSPQHDNKGSLLLLSIILLLSFLF